jgi:hypothetical protein
MVVYWSRQPDHHVSDGLQQPRDIPGVFQKVVAFFKLPT